MLGAAVAQVLAEATPLALPLPRQKDPRAGRHAGLFDLSRVRPASRAVAIALAAHLSCAKRGKDDCDEQSHVGGDYDHPMAAREDRRRHPASPVAPVPDEEAPRGIERAYGKDPHHHRAQEKRGCQATNGRSERRRDREREESHSRQAQQKTQRRGRGEEGTPQCGLEAEAPGGPLRRRPESAEQEAYGNERRAQKESCCGARGRRRQAVKNRRTPHSVSTRRGSRVTLANTIIA